jgi:uncharacterized membrane protein YhaH (DUF805 family)
MGIQEAVASCISNYVGFEDRAERSEFWWWVLFVLAVWVIIWSVGGALWGIDSGAGAVAGGMLLLVAFLPSVAAAVRRLHDCDRNGWWLMLMAVPVFGWVAVVWFLTRPGTMGPNRFGNGAPVLIPF